MDAIARALVSAQDKAEALFQQVVDSGMIRAGKLESELSQEIHALAQSRFGLRRHWHKRIARSGPNTVLTYHDAASDRTIAGDDIVYLDFGRTYALGSDPYKHRLVDDIAAAFQRGQQLYQRTPQLTAGQLYDFVVGLAAPGGWEFGAPTAGHLIGHFPHEIASDRSQRFSIRHGNEQRLREPDANGLARHWILEIHFVDRRRMIGGFFEQLLTIDADAAG
jgi:hypothetical protein